MWPRGAFWLCEGGGRSSRSPKGEGDRLVSQNNADKCPSRQLRSEAERPVPERRARPNVSLTLEASPRHRPSGREGSGELQGARSTPTPPKSILEATRVNPRKIEGSERALKGVDPPLLHPDLLCTPFSNEAKRGAPLYSGFPPEVVRPEVFRDRRGKGKGSESL